MAGANKTLTGRFVNLFDPELKVRQSVELTAGVRFFLLDLDAVKSSEPNHPTILASACKALPLPKADSKSAAWTVEGVGDTPGILLISSAKPPRTVEIDQQSLETFSYEAAEGLLYVRFPNEARPRVLTVEFLGKIPGWLAVAVS